MTKPQRAALTICLETPGTKLHMNMRNHLVAKGWLTYGFVVTEAGKAALAA